MKLARFSAARAWLAHRPWIGVVALVCVYIVGVAWRWLHVTRWHNPRKFVYSDMKMYVDLGTRLARPEYEPGLYDVTHPPGMSELIAFFMRLDGHLNGLVLLQVVVSCLVPLAVGAFAWAALDRRAGAYALTISCLYFPFVDFAGYFLAEIYMMLLVPTTLALYLVANRVERAWQAVALALVGGLTFFTAMAMKMVALPALLGFALVHWVVARAPSRTRRTLVLGAFVVATLPGLAAISDRCTTANEGQFCLGSNKSSADFLLGHYGRIQGIKWVDKKRGAVVSFGSPSAYQHGYRDVPEVQFGITDGPANSDAAWGWIKENKMHALVLSFEHVFDMLGATLPWPSVATGYWVGAQGTQYLFLVLLMFPSAIRLVDIWRTDGFISMVRSTEAIAIAPIWGVIAAVFIATGEPRYRMPFDSVFIVVGISFYRTWFTSRRTRRETPCPERAESHSRSPGETADEALSDSTAA